MRGNRHPSPLEMKPCHSTPSVRGRAFTGDWCDPSRIRQIQFLSCGCWFAGMPWQWPWWLPNGASGRPCVRVHVCLLVSEFPVFIYINKLVVDWTPPLPHYNFHHIACQGLLICAACVTLIRAEVTHSVTSIITHTPFHHHLSFTPLLTQIKRILTEYAAEEMLVHYWNYAECFCADVCNLQTETDSSWLRTLSGSFALQTSNFGAARTEKSQIKTIKKKTFVILI